MHCRPSQFLSTKAVVCLCITTAMTAIVPIVGFTNAAVAQSLSAASLAQAKQDNVLSNYESAIVYLPDAQTRELVPHSVLVTVDQPVTGAIGEILRSYRGRDLGIQAYQVAINLNREAEVNFVVADPRGADAFQSLSSADQVALTEAIRETLLTQPDYQINEVIFKANGETIDI